MARSRRHDDLADARPAGEENVVEPLFEERLCHLDASVDNDEVAGVELIADHVRYEP